VNGGHTIPWRLRRCSALLAGFLVSFLWGQKPAATDGSDAATFGTTVVIPGGLRGDIYFLDRGTPFLPNFRKLQPVGRIYASELNVTPRSWMAGFPGITTRFEWFGIDYHGRFWIDTPGMYRFSLTSDDGSELYIDERRVINNNGMHPPLSEDGRVELTAGVHDIRVAYFQGPPTELALVLRVARPGGRWKVFNTNDFKPPSNLEDWGTGDLDREFERRRRGEAAAMAALETRPRPHDFEFRAALFQFTGLESVARCAVVFEIPPRPPSDAQGEPEEARFSLLARIKDAGGHVADQYSVDLSGPPGLPLSSSHPLVLPAGRYTLEAAVVGRDGGRASTAITPVDVVEPRHGIGLSSVMLVRQLAPAIGYEEDPMVYQGQRLVPMLEPTLGAGTEPTAYFFVYPDKASADKPQIKVELLEDRRLVATQVSKLPRPDASGTIPMHLKTAAVPGNWELRITAIQGTDSVTRSIRYSIAAR
jgi:hypothetical protein